MTKPALPRLIAATCALFCLGAGVMQSSVSYAYSGPVTFDVQQVVNNDVPEHDTFTFRLTADDPTTPLPAGSNSTGYTFNIAGNTTATVGPIAYSKPGVYNYHLHCVNPKPADSTADTTVYAINVYVDANLDAVTVVTSTSGDKQNAVLFTQSLPQTGSSQSGDNPQTGDNSQPVLWLTMMIASAALLGLLVFVGVRMSRRANHGDAS